MLLHESRSGRRMMELTDADRQTIRERAYFKWLDSGAPSCDGVDYWLDAEFEYLHDDDRLRAEQTPKQRRQGPLTSRISARPAERKRMAEDEAVTSRD
jgi:hypothetical protein